MPSEKSRPHLGHSAHTGGARGSPKKRRRHHFKIGPYPLRLSWTTLIAVAVIAVLFVPTVDIFAPNSRVSAYLIAVVFGLLLLVSVLIHELAHAVAATRAGQRVHVIELNVWGGHTQFTSDNLTPLRSLGIAAVGPLSNLVLAGIGYAALNLEVSSELLGEATISRLIISALMFTNLALGVFNLLPGLPMDGGRILESVLWSAFKDQLKATYVSAWIGRLLSIAIAVFFLLLPLARGQTPSLTTGAWVILISGFLYVSANAAIRDVALQRKVQRLSVARHTQPAIFQSESATCQDLVRHLSTGTAGGAGDPGGVIALTDAEGGLFGLVAQDDFAKVPQHMRDVTPLSAVATRIPAPFTLEYGLEGTDMVSYMNENRASLYLVRDRGANVGILKTADVNAWLRR